MYKQYLAESVAAEAAEESEERPSGEDSGGDEPAGSDEDGGEDEAEDESPGLSAPLEAPAASPSQGTAPDGSVGTILRLMHKQRPPTRSEVAAPSISRKAGKSNAPAPTVASSSRSTIS